MVGSVRKSFSRQNNPSQKHANSFLNIEIYCLWNLNFLQCWEYSPTRCDKIFNYGTISISLPLLTFIHIFEPVQQSFDESI